MDEKLREQIRREKAEIKARWDAIAVELAGLPLPMMYSLRSAGVESKNQLRAMSDAELDRMISPSSPRRIKRVRQWLAGTLQPPKTQRAKFEEWATVTMLFASDELTFTDTRNAYDRYEIHLAWQAWRAAISKRKGG